MAYFTLWPLKLQTVVVVSSSSLSSLSIYFALQANLKSPLLPLVHRYHSERTQNDLHAHERYLDLVYTPNDFANAINPGFILDLSNRSAESYDESLKVLFNNLKGMGITDNIGIFKVGKIPENF